MNRATLLAIIVAALSAAGPAGAGGVEWHGFVEGGYGLRTAEDAWFDGAKDYTLEETRAQLRMSSFGSRGEAFLRLDLIQDQVVSGSTEIELREGYLRFGLLGDHLDIKAGRQALTWGTGDLIFVNDLFAKDWVSFFIGREDQYLKAPADAARLGIYGLPFDLDLVLTPAFTPDRLPDGSRLSFYAPPGVTGPAEEPAGVAENGEVALRASRYVGSAQLSLYGYRGFFKTPQGMTAEGTPFYPELWVYGASLRGAGLGGVYWIEGGYYDSEEDRSGDDPLIANSSARLLAGFERQFLTDFNVGLQWYGEWMLDHDEYASALPAGAWEQDELRQIVTVRAEKMLHYQTVRLSLFTFYSPTDEDVHLRPMVSYKVSDEVEVALGANVFDGNNEETQFGQFDKNDNVYSRIRYSF